MSRWRNEITLRYTCSLNLLDENEFSWKQDSFSLLLNLPESYLFSQWEILHFLYSLCHLYSLEFYPQILAKSFLSTLKLLDSIRRPFSPWKVFVFESQLSCQRPVQIFSTLLLPSYRSLALHPLNRYFNDYLCLEEPAFIITSISSTKSSNSLRRFSVLVLWNELLLDVFRLPQFWVVQFLYQETIVNRPFHILYYYFFGITLLLLTYLAASYQHS